MLCLGKLITISNTCLVVEEPLTKVGGWNRCQIRSKSISGWRNFFQLWSVLILISLTCPAELASKGKSQPPTFLCRWISCSNLYIFFFLSCIGLISCYSKTSPTQGSPLCNSPKYCHIITLLYESVVILNLDNLCWNRSRVRTERSFSFFKEDNFLVPGRSKEEGEFCFPPIPFSAIYPKGEPREEQPPVYCIL